MFIDSAFNNSLERKSILIIQRKQPREYSISLLSGNLTEKKKKNVSVVRRTDEFRETFLQGISKFCLRCLGSFRVVFIRKQLFAHSSRCSPRRGDDAILCIAVPACANYRSPLRAGYRPVSKARLYLFWRSAAPISSMSSKNSVLRLRDILCS